MSDSGGSIFLKETPPRHYRPKQPATWWLKRPNYILYMIREFTPIPMAAWLIWFLYQVYKLHNGTFVIQSISPAFIAFSAVCLFFTLWHAITFLSLSGLIMRVPIGDRVLAPIVVKGAAFGAMIVASILGGALFIYLGTVNL